MAVLLATWGLGLKDPNLKTFLNISVIVVGVIIASFGEFAFVLTGFIFQMGGIAFEATRLVMVERLLSSAEFKMDPLVSFYYFAPVCAVMNFVVSIFFELPYVSLADFDKVGYGTLLLNASIAFCLNVSVVFLVSSFDPYPILKNANFEDRENLLACHDTLRCAQRYPTCCRLGHDVWYPGDRSSIIRL